MRSSMAHERNEFMAKPIQGWILDAIGRTSDPKRQRMTTGPRRGNDATPGANRLAGAAT